MIVAVPVDVTQRAYGLCHSIATVVDDFCYRGRSVWPILCRALIEEMRSAHVDTPAP